MWKAVLAGTTALVIAGSTVVYAQQQRGNRQDGPRRGPTTEDMRAFADARLAGLRAGLSLNAEQQKHWPAFEEATRTMVIVPTLIASVEGGSRSVLGVGSGSGAARDTFGSSRGPRASALSRASASKTRSSAALAATRAPCSSGSTPSISRRAAIA